MTHESFESTITLSLLTLIVTACAALVGTHSNEAAIVIVNGVIAVTSLVGIVALGCVFLHGIHRLARKQVNLAVLQTMERMNKEDEPEPEDELPEGHTVVRLP